MKGKADWKRLPGKILRGVLLLALLVWIYLVLVMIQPHTEPREETAPQPLLNASPAVTIASEAEVGSAIRQFPGPVMTFMSGSGMTFVSGKAEDAPYQGRYGRILTLYWQTAEGEPMILQSIYPAEALELMGKGDYVFSAVSGPTLFGASSVRMENGDTVRIHVQAAGRGLYTVTVPKSLESSLSRICQSIQLYEAGEEEREKE